LAAVADDVGVAVGGVAGVAVSDHLAVDSAEAAAGSAVVLVDSVAAAAVDSEDSAAVAAVAAVLGDPGRWFVVRGSWFVVRGSWFVVGGSWLVVPGCSFARVDLLSFLEVGRW